MATIQSLIDGVKAAIDPITPAKVPVTPRRLGTDTSCSLSRQDDITVPPGGFSASMRSATVCRMRETYPSATLGTVPVDVVYSGGRFSNGNVWVQDLAQNLGLAHQNPAWRVERISPMAGRRRGRPRSMPPIRPTCRRQAWAVRRCVPSPSPTALYTVWAGSNDVLDIANSTQTPAQQQASVQQAVNNEVGFIAGLISHGAKDLVVMSVPDLGETPYESPPGQRGDVEHSGPDLQQ